MLFEKTRENGDVVTIKLTSGEEIIARFEEDSVDGIKVSKPMVLSMSQQGVGMIPYLFTVNPNNTIKFNHSSVAVVASTDEDFGKRYMEATTGIKLA